MVQKFIKKTQWQHFAINFVMYDFPKRMKIICQMNAFGLVFHLVYIFLLFVKTILSIIWVLMMLLPFLINFCTLEAFKYHITHFSLPFRNPSPTSHSSITFGSTHTHTHTHAHTPPPPHYHLLLLKLRCILIYFYVFSPIF